jgi:hypothetical protein
MLHARDREFSAQDKAPDVGSNMRGASALKRVTVLANELAAGSAKARELVRELFIAFKEVEREYARPKPIDEAPRDGERTLLLYCPQQGGWHAGEWFRGRWAAAIDQTRTLEPTHWLAGPEPPETRMPETPNEKVVVRRILDMADTGAFETCSEIAVAL